MATTLLTAYLTIAAAAAVIVYVVSGRAADERRPVTTRAPLSLVAGLMWPLLLIGLVEFTSFAAYAKVHENDDVDQGVAVLV